MSRRFELAKQLDQLLSPETELESTLIQAPEFRRGLLWGEPRFGHPEGLVALHVQEVLRNISLLPNLTTAERNQLRLIALAHDTFKYAEDRSKPRGQRTHHGRLARIFMESYTSDSIILDVIETHDEAYYQWLSFKRSTVHASLDAFFNQLGDKLRIYYLFFKCDTQTGDKTQAPLRWFEKHLKGIDFIQIKPFWPWERV
ncbi:MAG: hypothetical protein JNJ57_16055 [Saprospiraceae bacterium]|nr:hypothetical protein [Saprospiraceae bacterium]